MSTDPIRIDWDDLEDPKPEPVPELRSSEASDSAPSEEVVFDRLESAVLGPNRRGDRPVHRRAWFYSTVAGVVGGALAWGTSELLIDLEGSDESPLMTFVVVILWSALLGTVITALLASAESFVIGARRRMLRYAGLGAACGFLLGGCAGFVAQFVFSILLSLWAETGAGAGGEIALLIVARGLGWAALGAGCGMTCGLVARSGRKTVLGAIGGGLGGLMGGVLFDPLTILWPGQETAALPRLLGLVLFASLTGLFVSLAESVAKATWLQIERGRLSGKQFILYRNPTIIGSNPDCDVYLFKDPAVAPVAATIERTPAGYTLTAERTVRVNHRPVRHHRLRNGDAIAIGETVLRFGEKR